MCNYLIERSRQIMPAAADEQITIRTITQYIYLCFISPEESKKNN